MALLGDNSCAWVAAYLGAMAHGAVAAPLNTRQAEGALDRTLENLDPAAIVGNPPYLSRVPERYRSRAVESADVAATGPPAPVLDGSEARAENVGSPEHVSASPPPRPVPSLPGSAAPPAAPER